MAAGEVGVGNLREAEFGHATILFAGSYISFGVGKVTIAGTSSSPAHEACEKYRPHLHEETRARARSSSDNGEAVTQG
jgi:hypothetical protein